MKVKICGMRDPENIRAAANLPIDLMGFIFYEKSSRYVSSTGILPVPANVQRVGVFVNADIDFVLEKIKIHQLNYLQLHGDETPEYCRDIQAEIKASRTLPIAIGIKGEPPALFPDSEEIKLIKAFRVNDDFDFSQTKKYERYCAYFLFDTKKNTNAVLPPTPPESSTGQASKGGDEMGAFSSKRGDEIGDSPPEEKDMDVSSFSRSEKYTPLEGASRPSSPPLEGGRGEEYGGTGKKFNWQLLQQYTGNTPFLLSGGIGAEDVQAVQNFSHPKFAGIDVNSKFEVKPALKDVGKIEDFLDELLS